MKLVSNGSLMACLCFCGNKSAQFCWEVFVFYLCGLWKARSKCIKNVTAFLARTEWTVTPHYSVTTVWVQFSKGFSFKPQHHRRGQLRGIYWLRNIYLLLVKTLFVCTYIISPYPKQWMWLDYTSCFPSLRPVKVSVYLRWSNVGVPVLHYSLANVITAIIVA